MAPVRMQLLLLGVFICAVIPTADAREAATLVIGDSVVSVSAYGYDPADRDVHPQVALVLSGGGARGFAHIPVIEAIERAGIPIDLVVGTSMGSLVGGLYAAGYSPADMRRLIDQYDLIGLFSISPVAQPPAARPLARSRDNLFTLDFDEGGIGATAGIIGDQRILLMLTDALSRVAAITDFDRLAIPFRCVGTDAVTGEKVVFDSGSLVDAIRGSISIPTVFTPYPIDGRLIVDGGFVDNLPIDLARQTGADIVIAVDVNAVDYDITADELDSYTAMVTHMLRLVTKNTVVGQLAGADILVTPDLSEYGVLNFASVDGILEVGTQAALLRRDDFAALAARIGATRDLAYRDPQRYGPYFTLPDVFISTVSHKVLPGSPEPSRPFDLAPFERFAGLPLDTVRKAEIQELFESIRAEGEYATLTYAFTDAYRGKSYAVYGNLEIQTRGFPQRRSSIGVGASGETSMTFLDSTAQFVFRPDFSVSFRHASLFGTPAVLTLDAANDDAFRFDGSVSYPFGRGFSLDGRLAFATGAIHPLNLQDSFSRENARDRKLAPGLVLSHRYGSTSMATLASEVDFFRYDGDDSDSDSEVSEVAVPMLKFEAVRTDMPFGFFPSEGLRADFSAWLSYEYARAGYRIEAMFQQAFALGPSDTVGYDLHAGSSRLGSPAKEDYFDYGGSRGMPSYPSLTFVDDMVMVRLKYLHWLSRSPGSFVVQTMVAFGSRGETVSELLSEDRFAVNKKSFPGTLGTMETAISVALGYSTDFVELLVGVAVDTDSRVSVFLEVM